MINLYFFQCWMDPLMTVCGEMSLRFLAILYCVTTGARAAKPLEPHAKFSLSSLYDATLPLLHPVVAAGSNRCEILKDFLGITYEQMQEKNQTNYHEILNIDVITKAGNVKYNMTSTRRLSRVMASAKTVIILIHGFMESSDGWMVQALAPEYLKKTGLKILALDGRKLITYEYFRASTQVRFMGEKLGKLLSEIVKNGQDPSKMVLIGHSLGAHIAGIAGKKVQELTGKLVGRITALDPAGPCFSNVGAASRLGRTDAQYVDVVHTNAGMLGLSEPVGHKDFYPNGGLTQPGCLLATCDHTRAWELLAEAINSPDHFPARKCENRTLFRSGACAQNEIAYMGDPAGSAGIYFFNTASSPPFGLGVSGIK